MIVIRKLGIVVSAAAIGGAALTGALLAGTAQAQSSDSISVTSATLGAPVGNELGSEEAVLTFSVTCPAGDGGIINVTTSQGGTGTGHDSEFACTGSAQSVTVDATSSSDYGAGQVFVGASLDVVILGSSSVGPFGIGAGAASIVSIQ